MIDPQDSVAYAIYENPGVFALLLGSGVSRAASIPTGWEITLELARRTAALRGEENLDNVEQWYVESFSEAPNYSRLLDALSTTPSERRAIIHRFIEPTPSEVDEGKKIPTDAHRAIAALVRDGWIKVIVTTNFDRLLENALKAVGVEPVVIRSDDDAIGAAPVAHARCFILKVHGDYLDDRILNTELELENYSDAQNKLLDRIFDDYGLVVCGWSGDWDPALRSAISRAPNRRYPVYWAARSEPAGRASELLSGRAGKYVNVRDADTFFTQIETKVGALQRLNSPSPLSIDILVATAKRYIARPEHRVSLMEMFVEEAKKARESINAANIMSARGSYSIEEFSRRREQFEASSTALKHLFFLLGKWGDDTEQDSTREILREFSEYGHQNGLVDWNSLRFYPGVLLWYSYGLGAASSRRYRALREWINQKLRDQDTSELQPAFKQLFLWEWPGQRLPWLGSENRNTLSVPLSDHLRSHLGPLFRREFVSETAFDRIFEQFELLASVEHLSNSFDRTTLTALHTSSRVSNTPLGSMRSLSWDGSGPPLQDLRDKDMLLTLANAHFGNGDWSLIELAGQDFLKSLSHRRFGR